MDLTFIGDLQNLYIKLILIEDFQKSLFVPKTPRRHSFNRRPLKGIFV